MSIRLRRIIILAAGALIILISLAPDLHIPFLYRPFLTLWWGGLHLMDATAKLFPPGPSCQNLNTSHRDIFISLSRVGLALAISLSLVFCFWERRVTPRARTLPYFFFLILLLSLSTANFASLDSLLNRKAQALIDFVLVIIGLIVISVLIRMRPASPEATIIRAVVVFLVVLQGIALPGLWGLLWLLNWEGAIPYHQTLNPAWISAIAAVASALIAALNYRNSKRQSMERERGKIISSKE